MAHGLDATCKYRDGKIVVEAYYDTGKPAVNAATYVTKELEKFSLRGMTDAAGRWQFDHPGPGQYVLTVSHVDGGEEHRATKRFTLTDTELAPDTVVSGGVSREWFTGYAWLKVVGGIALIAVVFAGLWFIVRTPKTKSGDPPVQ